MYLNVPFSLVGFDDAIPETKIGMQMDTNAPKIPSKELVDSFFIMLSNSITAHSGIEENTKKITVCKITGYIVFFDIFILVTKFSHI